MIGEPMPFRKVLICGLPGSGKTWLARELAYHFRVPHYCADTVREFYNDWDFTPSGRRRQAQRMGNYWGILDFVSPTESLRKIANPSFTIWMDTINEGIYEDTNKLFEQPTNYDLRIDKWIGLNQLHRCLEDFNPGMKGIQSFLEGPIQKLVK